MSSFFQECIIGVLPVKVQAEMTAKSKRKVKAATMRSNMSDTYFTIAA